MRRAELWKGVISVRWFFRTPVSRSFSPRVLMSGRAAVSGISANVMWSTSIEEVREEQQQRDLQDTSRAESPLQVARGSVVVDTTGLTLDQVVERLLEEVARIR